MKPIIKKIFLRSITLFMLFILSGMLMSCQAEDSREVIKEPKAEQSSKIGIKAVNERLIVRDFIGGDLANRGPFWCGSGPMLAYTIRGGGYFVQNVETGEVIPVADNTYGEPIGCTPDGKWLLYMDRNSTRVYKDKHGLLLENFVYEGPGGGGYGYISDLYRYELTTGIWQKFAVVRDDSRSLVSPDGAKVLLGRKHDSTIDIPELEWEKVWLTNDWDTYSTNWLADSSGILTILWGDSVDGFGVASLGVEIFGEDGWAREFSLEQSVCVGEVGCEVSLEAVDKENRFYLIKEEAIIDDYDRRTVEKRHFFLCKIEQKELLCEETGTSEVGAQYYDLGEFLPNGDYILSSLNNNANCIQHFRLEQPDAICIADTRYGNETYEDVYLCTVSSDGKWMAFRRGKSRYEKYQYDLFVMELPKD